MVSASILLLLINALDIIVINGQCKWSGLDLSCLAGKSISLKDDSRHLFTYTVCGDSTSCPENTDGRMSGRAMVSQVNDDDDNLCFILGKYESSIAPMQTDDNPDGSFQFSYPNGDPKDCPVNRTWSPTFICQPGVEFNASNVIEDPDNQCVYDAKIYTKYACTASQISCSDDSSALSGGWIFIIILICGLFAYFCVGYIVMALTINKQGGFKDFSNNIPNKAIWVNCIPLVVAGCVVTKDFIVGLTNRGGSDKEDTLVEDSAGNEETS